MHLTAGEIYGTTAGQELGFPLTFITPELQAELTGTTFAVWRMDSGSCVCLWTGAVEVAPHGEEAVNVPVKQRYMVYKDGRRELQEIDARERMKLNMMYDGGVPKLPFGNGE
jgi:ferric-dicitrate binding protein FerR (iron transport regulator)